MKNIVRETFVSFSKPSVEFSIMVAIVKLL